MSIVSADLSQFRQMQDTLDGPWADVLDSLVPIIQGGERTIFLNETTPEGIPWEALSDITVSRKGFSKKLVETGRLYESVTTANGTADTIWETSEDPAYLVFGTSVPYGRFHMTGTKRMPARPFMGISSQTFDRVAEAVAEAATAKLVTGR